MEPQETANTAWERGKIFHNWRIKIVSRGLVADVDSELRGRQPYDG